MVSKENFSDLRGKMLQRRKDIFEFRRTVNTSWRSLHEPEKELEETASKETMSTGLAKLDDRGQAEISEIDHALTKMDEGRFGKCEACRRPISLKRLQVDAYTSLSEGEPMTPPDKLVPEERRSGHK